MINFIPLLLSIGIFQPLMLPVKASEPPPSSDSWALPGCPKTCGNLSVPYPFGIGPGCFRDGLRDGLRHGFEINCTWAADSRIYTPWIFNIPVINISLTSGQALVYNSMSFSCFNSSGNYLPNNSVDFSFDFINTSYKLSYTRNKFTAIGCETLAYIEGPVRQDYTSGCVSICRNESNIPKDGQCSGMGCCQTSIPKGLQYYKALFDTGFNHRSVWSFNPCGYAFLVDQDWYKFNSSDVHFFNAYDRNNKQVPMVLDWAIGTETCEVAKQNKTGNYACASENSDCIDSTNGPGYICNCSTGYRGNPYLQNGCQDINECNFPEEYACHGDCSNLPGNYSCLCPSGTQGDAYKQGGCTRNRHWIKWVIGGLCLFLVAAGMYLVFEKVKLMRAKQKCFRQNGGLLLREQINAHRGLRFKIFSKEEIERATKNFDPLNVLGQGGHGTVFKGRLDDKTIVAIKRSTITNESQKKEFAREMYLLSLINHKHVIKILGCCLEVEVPILVYEFLSKGTLLQCILNKKLRMPLSFRLKLAIESASAFAYLHSDACDQILHGDVKSSNILLDDKNAAKVSDFGASQLSLMGESQLAPAQGTSGYIDPEYWQTCELTEKVDVYSFAVVVLELFTRKMAIYSDGSSLAKKSLASTFKDKGTLVGILDDEIKDEMVEEQIREADELLKKCLAERGEERPTMKEVAERLQTLRKLTPNLEEMKTSHVPSSSSSHPTAERTEYHSFENQAVINISTR